MMRVMRLLAAVAGSVVLASGAASAQGVAVGARVGTLGLGGEVAVGLGPRLQLRGGIGAIPVTPTGTFSEVDYEVEPPSPLLTLGADVYLLRSVRLFGGVLFGAEETNITGDYTGSVEIGGETYDRSDVGVLRGTVRTTSAAPYAGLGFGRHVAAGFGLTLDLGVAFLGESDLELTASGPIASDPLFQAELEEERRSVEDDLREYTRLLPIVSLGFRFGL